MSNKCNRCGTTFDSPFCPNCGAPAQPHVNQQSETNQQLPPMPPQMLPNNSYQQNQFRPNSNIQPPIKKSHGCLFYGLMTFGIVVFIFIFSAIVTSCLDSVVNHTDDTVTTNNKTAINENITSGKNTLKSTEPVMTTTPTPDKYLTQDEIQYLYTDTKKYIGKRVKLSGKVFGDPETDEDGVYFQMFQDTASSENSTIVAYMGKLKIKDGDYVIIDGTVHDMFKGSNYFGATLKAPAITADSIKISTYKDVVAPALKTIKIYKSQKQYGYKIAIKKIEFSKIETRVYIGIDNNGKSNFTASSYNMKIKQNKKQYEAQTNYEANYPEIQTDLMPGTVTSGIVCFPAISQKDNFTLYIDGSSDNWEEDLKDYKFEIDNK